MLDYYRHLRRLRMDGAHLYSRADLLRHLHDRDRSKIGLKIYCLGGFFGCWSGRSWLLDWSCRCYLRIDYFAHFIILLQMRVRVLLLFISIGLC